MIALCLEHVIYACLFGGIFNIGRVLPCGSRDRHPFSVVKIRRLCNGAVQVTSTAFARRDNERESLK
jgi:hypothetical protein